MQVECSKCHHLVDDSASFCQFCGFEIKAKNKLSTGEIVKIYVFSIILAPFSLYWFFKYFKNPRSCIRRVAYFSLIITLISTGISVIIVTQYISAVKQYSELYNTNLQLYQSL